MQLSQAHENEQEHLITEDVSTSASSLLQTQETNVTEEKKTEESSSHIETQHTIPTLSGGNTGPQHSHHPANFEELSLFFSLLKHAMRETEHASFPPRNIPLLPGFSLDQVSFVPNVPVNPPVSQPSQPAQTHKAQNVLQTFLTNDAFAPLSFSILALSFGSLLAAADTSSTSVAALNITVSFVSLILGTALMSNYTKFFTKPNVTLSEQLSVLLNSIISLSWGAIILRKFLGGLSINDTITPDNTNVDKNSPTLEL